MASDWSALLAHTIDNVVVCHRPKRPMTQVHVLRTEGNTFKILQKIEAAGQAVDRLKVVDVELALGGPKGLRSEGPGLAQGIANVAERLEAIKGRIKALPFHVPVGQVQDRDSVDQVEQECKRIASQVKMVAYGADAELANLVGPLLGPHHVDEPRSFLRQVFQLTADLVPDPEGGPLTVRLHGMASWRFSRAPAGLCEVLRAYETSNLGSQLRLGLQASRSEE